ncbi:hypothetical protein LI168_03100 [Desulfovibrio desulfuricans]|uniref:hypothetical protein n=1 Tax=Desulfovibrio desulfuricans TaxID=876 RepID=UPI001D06A639|nr:hypothetical protein [Desulfovibrio desulfuricans]MCB6541123.1 hypothetical protein [Desulfovibrio desulfuricans]MCB6552205.1 hypothetical protein [Desulfovibrio desulfuricans]MCB6564048.1 hypothetical protein [Desulfovibrio desulfuricans]MCB7345228.1 hypothetical protein [Desulfovibrio desulfuricans]MCQ5217318.1 hypothetical protein [Desulfovibrio desulfuricans]
MNTQEIKQIISEGEYNYYALRVVNGENIIHGQEMPNSRRWHDGNPINAYVWACEEDVEGYESQGYERMSDGDAELMQVNGYYGAGEALMVNWSEYQTLSGACGVEITEENADRIISRMSMYNGDQIVLIAGDNAEYGEDCGEIIIENAVALNVCNR